MLRISRAKLGAVKGNPKRFWLQIAGEIAGRPFFGKELRQKRVSNSGLTGQEPRRVA
jgi:hypothetical protein